MKYLKLIMIVLFMCQIQINAQTRKIYEFQDCNSSNWVKMTRGDTLVVNCRSLFLYTELAQKQLLATEMKKDSLLDLLQQRQTVLDSISSVKDSLITRFEKIMEIQNTSYNTLLSKFNKMDSLAVRSTQNTDKALGLITRMKLISYATGGLMGSVTGGSVVGSFEKGDGFQFNLIGAVLGGVFGIGLNYLLLNR